MDVMIHLGSGACSELDSYLEKDYERIILVEVHPDLVSELKEHSDKRIEVYNYALAKEAKDEVFKVFNLSEVSSLKEAKGLKSLYPGLRLSYEVPLTTKPVAQFLDELGLDETTRLDFKIELYGIEEDTLLSLLTHKLASQIRSLELSISAEPLYEDQASKDHLTDLLEEHNFSLEQFSDEDPDFPTYLFQIDNKKIEKEVIETKSQEEILELKKELSLIKEKNLELEFSLREKEAEIKGLKLRLEDGFKSASSVQDLKDELSLLRKENLDTSKMLFKAELSLQSERRRAEDFEGELEVLRKEALSLKEELSASEKNWLIVQEDSAEQKKKEALVDRELIKADAQLEFLRGVLVGR